MKRKGLSSEDRELWERVKRTATPMHAALPELPTAKPKPKPMPRNDHTIAPFQLGDRARATTLTHDVLPTISERVHAAPLRMDGKTFKTMKRGKLRPEGKLDLHGMTLASAHPRLTGFVLDAHAQGKRLVLIVTGKGKDRREDGPIPIRRGVLKHQVPQWLAMPPLGAVVLQVTEAHLAHGGSGAYYVYLRRAR